MTFSIYDEICEFFNNCETDKEKEQFIINLRHFADKFEGEMKDEN